jgi:hypothetical protein
LIFDDGDRERRDSKLLPQPFDQPFELREPLGVAGGGVGRRALRGRKRRGEAADEQEQTAC